MVDLPEEYKELVSGPQNVDCGEGSHRFRKVQFF